VISSRSYSDKFGQSVPERTSEAISMLDSVLNPLVSLVKSLDRPGYLSCLLRTVR
jgi:hypothetical protein